MKNVFSLDQFEINGDFFYTINYTVDGYWSNDLISTYVSRENVWEQNTSLWKGVWRVSVSHSSGGRDTNAIVNDWEAEANFAKTLADVCTFAKELSSQSFTDRLEEAYQIQVKKYIKEKEEEEAALAQIPRVSSAAAKLIIDKLKNGTISKVELNYPGSKITHIISTEKTTSGRNALRYCGSAITYNTALGVLCKAEEETIEITNAN